MPFGIEQTFSTFVIHFIDAESQCIDINKSHNILDQWNYAMNIKFMWHLLSDGWKKSNNQSNKTTDLNWIL